MTFFSNLLAPLTRRRRKVTITTNETNRSPPPPPPPQEQEQKGELQPEFKPTTLAGQQEHHVVILAEPRTSITSSTSVNVESLEFKASQELAVSLNVWDDYQPAVMPSFPAFEHLLRQ